MTSPRGEHLNQLILCPIPEDTTFGDDQQGSQVAWVGMSPMDFVEHVAGIVQDDLQRRKRNPPTLKKRTVDSHINFGIEFLVSQISQHPSTIQTQVMKNDSMESKTFQQHDLTSHGMHPRQNISKEDDRGCCYNDIGYISLPPWDVNYLLEIDSDPEIAKETQKKLQMMAREIEGHPSYSSCIPSYLRIREFLVDSVKLVCTEVSTIETKRSLLDNLYQETISRMKALIEMASHQPYQNNLVDSVVQEPFCPSGDSNQGSLASITSASIMPQTTQTGIKAANNNDPKKEFVDYMSKWIRDNWTNPYPDEDELEKMARDCRTETTIIRNWLINARTRKWRPSIIKAYEMGRPSAYLLEDSLNVFDHKPVREVKGMKVVEGCSLKDRKRKNIKKRLEKP